MKEMWEANFAHSLCVILVSLCKEWSLCAGISLAFISFSDLIYRIWVTLICHSIWSLYWATPSVFIHVLALLGIPFFSSTDRSTPCNIQGLILCVSHNTKQMWSSNNNHSIWNGVYGNVITRLSDTPHWAFSQSPQRFSIFLKDTKTVCL